MGFLLLGVALLYNYPLVFEKGPYGYHRWRQSDALSMTLNYMKEGMDFFQPRVHFQGIREGRGVAEFPLLYYLNAGLWKVTGQSEFLFRLINVLITFTGLFFLFRLFRDVLKSTFWSVVPVLFLFTSPILAFYSNNFLVNAPALGLLFCGWYCFFRFRERGRSRTLAWAMLWVTLAGLFRVTLFHGAGFLYVLYGLERFTLLRFGKGGRPLFHRPLDHALFLLAPIALLGGWYAYAVHYNELYDSIYFLTGTRAFWEGSWGDLWTITSKLYHEWLPDLFPRAGLAFLFLALLVVLFRWRRQRSALIIATTVTALGAAAYTALWYRHLDVHDYYLIDLFPVFALVLLTLLDDTRRHLPALLYSRALRGVAVVALAGFLYNATIVMRMRYTPHVPTVQNAFTHTEEEKDFWEWFKWDHNHRFGPLQTITPYLRSLGIEREDKVISIPDKSPNVSLYLMDQKGFTNIYMGDKRGQALVEHGMGKGAGYLIINAPSIMEQQDFGPYTDDLMGIHEGVHIYRLPITAQ